MPLVICRQVEGRTEERKADARKEDDGEPKDVAGTVHLQETRAQLS